MEFKESKEKLKEMLAPRPKVVGGDKLVNYQGMDAYTETLMKTVNGKFDKTGDTLSGNVVYSNDNTGMKWALGQNVVGRTDGIISVKALEDRVKNEGLWLYKDKKAYLYADNLMTNEKEVISAINGIQSEAWNDKNCKKWVGPNGKTGYTALKNGFMIQHGEIIYSKVKGSETISKVAFPTRFPNKCQTVLITVYTYSGTWDNVVVVANTSDQNGFTPSVGPKKQEGNLGFFWTAIGY